MRNSMTHRYASLAIKLGLVIGLVGILIWALSPADQRLFATPLWQKGLQVAAAIEPDHDPNRPWASIGPAPIPNGQITVRANFANWLKTSAGQNSYFAMASLSSDSTLAGTGTPLLAKQSGSPAIQTFGLTPVDNGQIVYDANQQVYWLANANLAADPTIRATLGVTGINPNGTMTFTTALLWVKALNHANNGSGYLGHTNWQLPVTPPVDTTCSVLAGNNGNSFGANCTKSALGNLFYVGLTRTFPNSVVPVFTDTIGPFQNLQPSLYWTSQAQGGGGQKTYSFLSGLTGANTTTYNYFYVLPMVTNTIGTIGPGSGLVPYISSPVAGKAIYDTVAHVTWVLDANLAASDNFGLTGTTTITTSGGNSLTVPLINTSGAMLFATADLWLEAMKNGSYAGTNNWTLPALADLQTLFSHLNLQPGDSRLTAHGSVGPFQSLQPFFYWACERDQDGNSQSPCNGSIPGTSPNGTPMEWSFNLDTGFQATDLDTKEFYVAVYYPVSTVMLPIIVRSN